jgi:type I restriction enzyme S subunit
MTNSQNWKLETIESIANGGLIADGDWVESKDQDFEGKIRLTQLADVGDGEFRNRSNRWMNEEQVTRLDVTFLKPNDILIARMPDPLGRACLVPANIGRAVTVVDVAILRIARKDILPKYITLLLNSPQIRQQMLLLASGTTRQRISRRNLQSIDLPVPSPGVQEEIVEILEDHLSRLDAALADVKQAKLKAAQFRVSFMRDVFRGTQDWEHLKLRELGKWQGGGTPSKSNPAYWTNGTIPWISPKDMGLDEISSTQDLISEDAVSNSSVNKIDANSVVVVVRSGILERVLPISIINMTATLNQDMKALTLNDRVLPKFAFYLLQAFQQDILQKCRKTGTTVASINTEALMNYEVKVPTIREQESLLAYLESQISRIQGSTKLIDVAEKTGSSLRRSLLQAAFTGQLTKKEVNV